MITLAVVGALALWFALGYLFEITLRRFVPSVKYHPALLWVECAIVYGPFGIAVLVWEKYESRRWRHQ